ncbi:MAG TPA: exodeoxyribonuclease VII large subunit, partial [Agromyces sp.]|nr:exodeoxyribonuclease VII large subunit [Agromyces sp.]
TREIDRIGHLRARPALAGSGWIIERRAEELTRWVARGTEMVGRCIERQTDRVSELRGHLRALSPLATLDRGYAIVQGDDGHVLRSPDGAPEGTRMTLTLAGGRLGAVSTGPDTTEVESARPGSTGADRAVGGAE